jgi:hypothetical protein
LSFTAKMSSGGECGLWFANGWKGVKFCDYSFRLWTIVAAEGCEMSASIFASVETFSVTTCRKLSEKIKYLVRERFSYPLKDFLVRESISVAAPNISRSGQRLRHCKVCYDRAQFWCLLRLGKRPQPPHTHTHTHTLLRVTHNIFYGWPLNKTLRRHFSRQEIVRKRDLSDGKY